MNESGIRLKSRVVGVAAGILLLVMVWVAYLPALQCGFVYDDNFTITNNPHHKSITGFFRIWTDPIRSPLGHYWPLTYSIFWLEYQLWGTHPFGYHLVNIFLHSINVLLLWRLLRRLGLHGAWLAAALFAVHPVHVESVAWVTERKNVLSVLFYLLAFGAYLRYMTCKAGRYYALAFGLFVCSLLTKSIAVTLPVALVLFLWWQKDRLTRRELLALVPFFLLAAIVGVVHVTVYSHHHMEPSMLSLLDRFLIAGRALWFYAGKLLWPYPLMGIYPRWEIDPTALWQYFYPLAAIVVITMLFLLRQPLGKGPLVAVLFFAASLAPVLNIIDQPEYSSMTFVNDHAQYLPSIGLLALFAELVVRMARRFRSWGSRMLYPSVAAVLIALSILTWQHAKTFKSLETLFCHTLLFNPNNWAAHWGMGAVYTVSGKHELALKEFRESLRLTPRKDRLHIFLGYTYTQIGRIEEAMAHFREAHRIRPDSPEPVYNMGVIFALLGRYEEAIAHYRQTVELKPDHTPGRTSLANALAAVGRTDEAMKHYRLAVQHDPGNADLHNNLALAYAAEGNFEEAIRHYSRALRLNPRDPFIQFNMGLALQGLGRDQKARKHYAKALHLKPDFTDARMKLRPDEKAEEGIATEAPPSPAPSSSNMITPAFRRSP